MANGMLSLSIAKSSLQANQTALNVTSQNLANANSEGYARKVVSMTSMASLNMPDVIGISTTSQIGTGVQVSSIESVRDLLLNAQIRSNDSKLGDSAETLEVLDELETIFTGEGELAESLDDFFSALDDLAGSPESSSLRSVVLARANEFANRLVSAAESVEEQRVNLSDSLSDKVTTINSITAELAVINGEVGAMESAGMLGNDFEDRRQVLLEELATIGNVQVVNSAVPGVQSILFCGQTVVQGTQSFDVVEVPSTNPEKLATLKIEDAANGVLEPNSGVLNALYTLNDGTLTELEGDLNDLAVTLTTRFNAIHSAGYGLDDSTGVDFFTYGSQPGETALFGVTGTVGLEDASTPIDGDGTAGQTENLEATPVGQGELLVNGHAVTYDGSVDSLDAVVARINAANAGVTAFVTPENKLAITADEGTDFTVSTMSDSGLLLDHLGILPQNRVYPTAGVTPPTSVFSGDVELKPPVSAARNFAVTDAIQKDLNKIAAASQSGSPGDGSNALALAELRQAPIMDHGTTTCNEFIIGVVAELGVQANAAQRSVEALEATQEQLEERRQEIQGVSIDEELINMMKYQRGYQAAARIVTVADSIYETLLGLGA